MRKDKRKQRTAFWATDALSSRSRALTLSTTAFSLSLFSRILMEPKTASQFELAKIKMAREPSLVMSKPGVVLDRTLRSPAATAVAMMKVKRKRICRE